MKQSVYFFRCGMTTEMSLISSRTGSLPVAGAASTRFVTSCPLVLPVMDRSGTPPSRRRFLEAGSELAEDARLQT